MFLMVNSLAPAISVFIQIYQALPFSIQALISLSLALFFSFSIFRLLWGLH